MLSLIRPSLVMLVVFTVMTGIAYPFAMTGVAQVAFPRQANGSPLLRDGVVVGSSLIGQNFTTDRYFHGRLSATATAPYNAAASSGSNLGPTSKALAAQMAAAAASYGTAPIPADLVTASGSGLDPHISPAGAERQVEAVAKARGIPVDKVRALVAAHTEGLDFGLLGAPRVHVLDLNLALDRP